MSLGGTIRASNRSRHGHCCLLWALEAVRLGTSFYIQRDRESELVVKRKLVEVEQASAPQNVISLDSRAKSIRASSKRELHTHSDMLQKISFQPRKESGKCGGDRWLQRDSYDTSMPP